MVCHHGRAALSIRNEQRGKFLRIQPGGERARSNEIAEYHGHEPALGGGIRDQAAAVPRCRRAERNTAGRAETLAGSRWSSAGWAESRQRLTALGAKERAWCRRCVAAGARRGRRESVPGRCVRNQNRYTPTLTGCLQHVCAAVSLHH